MFPSCRISLLGLKPCKSGYIKNPKTIGEHIRKVRMDRNLLQKDVAKIIGVTEDCVTNWENNRSTPQIRYLPMIHDFLGYIPELYKEQKDWGNILLQYRREQGVTQKQLAKLIGIDERTLSKMEKKKGYIASKTKEKMILFKENIFDKK